MNIILEQSGHEVKKIFHFGICRSIVHLNVGSKIVLDEVVNLSATKHPQRLELGTILRKFLVLQYL